MFLAHGRTFLEDLRTKVVALEDESVGSSAEPRMVVAGHWGLTPACQWMTKRKKIKQGNLGEENRMHFHKELNRWIEIGKEEEAKQQAAGPPPPPIPAVGAFTSKPLHKRNLSQRYVLQPELSISSSMASLGGSLSQTDFAGLVGAGQGNTFSEPPSAMVSMASSPPQSGGGFNLPASFSL
ncbi:hypothetical protein VaNZ11_010965 [Volvox africanus]|uniref:Uncharacterized protein n=1 Tax=Volvox africanus TaxID=51714 RepID=A0ABQ5SBC5_9CHLO|nr:hypothetical protein VaNZ11_010965 [Volvox africanus]